MLGGAGGGNGRWGRLWASSQGRLPPCHFWVQNSEEAENSKFKPSISGHHEDKFIRIEG